MKYPLLEEIGEHFMDQALKLVRNGEKFVYVLDNIDWTVKVHDMRSDNQNKDVHAVATSLVFDRVPCKESMNSTSTKASLVNTDVKSIVAITNQEMSNTQERYKVLVARIICEFLEKFHFFKDLVPMHTSCDYEEEMKKKSIVVPFPVLMKDEKKYSDLVDVLDTLEAWCHDLFAKAGATPSCVPVVLPQPIIPMTSRPGQPAAHVPPTLSDTDPVPTIPCFGDQLSRVRLAGGKDLRAGAHTPRDRLEHLYPFRVADWHTKRSYLKVSQSFQIRLYCRLYAGNEIENGYGQIISRYCVVLHAMIQILTWKCLSCYL